MPVKVSEKPWSDYSASDYSPEQWHSACLIHQHEGAPTSKDQCKLPVRTPDGTVNRGGVKAAAAALAGARGGVDASSEEKSDAASALAKLYRHLNEDPPESLQHAIVDDFLAHYGTKGMRWGFRRSLRGTHPSGRAALITKKDAKWSAKVNRKPKLSKVSRIAARDTKKLVKKTNKDYKARGLNIKKDPLARSRYDSEINGHLQNSLGRAANRVHKVSPSRLSEVSIHRHPDGRIMATIVPRTNAKLTKQFGKIARTDARTAKKEAKAESIGHADTDDDVTEEDFLGLEFMFLTDEDDFVIDVVTPFDDDEMSHTDLADFLAIHAETSLKHASAEVVNVKPASDIADKSGDGKGNFDESKVKRDQGGKFSRQAFKGRLKDKLDKAWNDKLNNMHSEILGKHIDEFKKMMSKIAKKHGIDVHEIESNKEAKKEYSESSVSMLNRFAKKDGVSPSGSQRVEFTVGQNGQPKPHVVTHTGPNPNRLDTRDFVKDAVKSRVARSQITVDDTAGQSRAIETARADRKDNWWNFWHSDLDDFLAHFADVTLSHAAEAAVDTGSTGGDGKGKGGKFDESKVKRDKGGKFSKKEERRKDREEIKDELDQGWLDNLDWRKQSLIDKHREELTQMAKDIAAKHGIKNYDKGGPGAKAANQEFSKELIPRLNKWAADEGVNISPSGKKRMEFRLDKNTGEPKSVVSDYSGPNPNAGATRKYIQDTFEIRRVSRAAAREKDDGYSGMFNPDATLDTSRVRDASDSAETGDTSNQKHWWEFWHSDDLIGNFLSHANDKPNTTAVIVALPSEVDPIRLVGDEAKHGTLLFLGETSSLPNKTKEVLLETLAQVSKMVDPFSESVLDVSRLGSDNPPALVTMLTNRRLGMIRDMVQVNPEIKGYLSNAEQHPEYTPHVTLAYPDYQGEADLRKLTSSIRRIRFDRLALWWNDEHFEFDLKPSLDEPVSESAGWSESVGEFLAHHGIKGMKWGVRRSDSQLSRAGGRGPKENSTGKERSEGGTSGRAGSSMRTGLGSFGKRSERKSDYGDVPSGRSGGGYARGGSKKKGDNERLSADAERTLKTTQKKSHEMSDREMKEAIGRANQIKQYNQLFGVDHKSDLESAVEQLSLQKKYKDLQAELNPPKVSKVKQFASGAAKGFAAYQAIDQQFHGQLTSTMSRQLGLQKPLTPLEKLTMDNDFLSATKSNIALKVSVSDLNSLHSAILNGDSPSKAVGYLGAGKRRADGAHKIV